ncbi:MAG: hypothetical protein ACOYY3_00335 [Chloroflexota bacterium]
MKSRLPALLLITCLLAACAPSGSLWGVAASPTPDKVYALPTVAVMPTPVPPAATPTPTETPLPTITPTLTPIPETVPPIIYYSQGGDFLAAVAAHFGVQVGDIRSDIPLPETGLLEPNTLLVIPDVLETVGPGDKTIPDSEVANSPSAIGFDPLSYVSEAGGYLDQYKEYLTSTGWSSGAQSVQRTAIENSVNPRMLLALIEYESHWVLGQPTNLAESDYPLGNNNYYYKGLFRQMMWAVQQLSQGYYGWRNGHLTELTLADGTLVRMNPMLNAGTAALQYYFAQTRGLDEWQQALDPRVGFPALYADMFGDPWGRAVGVEPIFPTALTQPPLAFPFRPGPAWSLTGGPHAAWADKGALAALDFAPPSDKRGCMVSPHPVTASASGLVVRSERGVVMLDLDGDGYEQTGWNILYLHIHSEGRVPAGTWVNLNDPIGFPSCEGGVSTGTHVHMARKYNGEWVLADGPIPFNLNGWIAHNGSAPYLGSLTRDGLTITASKVGDSVSHVFRREGE